MDDPLAALARGDKYYLANGRGLLFAPPFPHFLDRPGFWDECFAADIRLDRVFTVLLLDDSGYPIRLRADSETRWTPASLARRYLADGLRLDESRTVTPRGSFVSRWRIDTDSPRRLHLFLWSQQTLRPLPDKTRAVSIAEPRDEGDCLCFIHRASGEKGTCDHHVSLGASLPRRSFTIDLAESHADEPVWEASVLPERFVKDASGAWTLPGTTIDGVDWGGSLFGETRVHLLQHYTVEVGPGEAQTIVFAASVSPDPKTALAALRADVAGDPVAESEDDWRSFLASAPTIETGDAHLDAYLPYRAYGLRLSTVDVSNFPPLNGTGASRIAFEGIGMFRSFISYSAQAHARDARWIDDGGRLAIGSVLGILGLQEPDGFLPGHTYTVRESRAFYHADWGDVALSVYAATGDRAFLDRVAAPLIRYADYFLRARDPESSHLFDIVDQNETGQEYMSRYLFADTRADDWRPIRLKGVDATVYAYRLLRAVAAIERLREVGDGAVWDARADATRDAVRSTMWSPELGFFVDVDPKSGERSPYPCVVGFYPFLCDLAGAEHLGAIRNWLLDPTRFWTEFPVPASPLSDPFFDASARWKGKRTNCPWNGRMWPMTNSHVADALAHAARALDPALRPIARDFMVGFVKTMFFDSDPDRPNCFEHYNPQTGAPALYRGIDDYQHSWVIDLYVRHLCGFLPDTNGSYTLDPLLDNRSWTLKNLPWRGCRLDLGFIPGETVRVRDSFAG